jgi:hypothetical protein
LTLLIAIICINFIDLQYMYINIWINSHLKIFNMALIVLKIFYSAIT